MPRFLIRFVTLTFAAALVGGCRSAPTELAALAAVSDEPPYIVGTILSRDDRFETQRSALVAVTPADPTDPRRAHVMLEGSPTVLRRSGLPASVADLRPGRVVSVWVTGPELRSYPPVVSARTVVIER